LTLERRIASRAPLCFDRYIFGNDIIDIGSWEPRLITILSRSALIAILAAIIGAVLSGPARTQSGASAGQRIAFDRSSGNCLTCHAIKGGDLPGSIGPELKDIKSKYPNRDELIAIVSDETKRNAQTLMPPFGRNRILTEQEIEAVVDFLQTL
jgi:L-cysteine S-thiosulfotransferase